MEETKKKKELYSKIFWKIFVALFFAFGALYLSEKTGYYEFQEHKQVNLTNEKIKEFESDIKSGKDINIKDYIDEKEVSFENGFSSTGIFLSETISHWLENGLNSTFDFLNSVFG